ncbi:mitogen-activated protein kinase-binding protein 1 [Plakobranchus ocellatus]|uniref:Mitogen-activated protein kinase-binding protein 1 n=1 Tax=Plakobranchus ocellatus TaxID=259542 RepID=A0AAV4AKJ6_9GAST|nr:mitogen-activated protein kinase-binding protein 1 [Plakobranchus ocellatus]
MLRGHSFGIKTAIFSPRMREIIVVGDAQDMMISVWTWPGKVMESLNKFSDEIFAMDVSSDSQYFVTVGNKHVKFYYLETKRWQGNVDHTCPIPLNCRYGMLDNLKENCFCDVACGRGHNQYVFVISTSGILCQINSNRFLERWVNVNMARAFCLSTDGDHVFVGGCQGVIRMFNAFNLKIVLTLPRPHCLGLDISQVTRSCEEAIQPSRGTRVNRQRQANLSPSVESAAAAATVTTEGTSRHSNSNIGSSSDEDEADQRRPGAKALTFDRCHQNLTVVYEDHSLYIWGRLPSRRDGQVFDFHKRLETSSSLS